MLNQNLAFIDVETTGINPNVHEIIELGAVVCRLDGQMLSVIDQLDVKVKPEHIETADPQALKVNGYDEGQWLFAYTLEEAMKMFAAKTKGAVMAAHNITFDYGFIERAFYKTKVPDEMYFQRLDTLSVAVIKAKELGDMNRFSLGALCQYYGIENKRAHSAFSDAYATYELFKKLMGFK